MHGHALENLFNHLKPDCRVLDVGSGSGYLTMCFARLILSQSVQSTGIVIGIDNNPHLVEFSIGNLNSDDPKFLSSGKIKIVKGDGRLGYPQYGPYDAIHVGAASSEAPKELLAQLKPGGRMMIPVGPKGETQKLELYDRMLNGKIETTTLMNVLYGSLKDYP
jgi:protein-L-isoaspartate(D-aspartate) O-methyltransferase